MPPVNDNLANARVINSNSSFSDTTVGATNEAGAETSDYSDVAVWYRLEWSATGCWRIKVTNAVPQYNVANDTHINFGSRIYVPTSDPPASISNLSETFDDRPRSQFTSSQGYIADEDIAQTFEYTSGHVMYLRLGSAQSSGFPYYTWTGTYDIEFEFITPPYNPGTAPSNDDMANATVLSTSHAPISGTTHGATEDVGGVWYRWEPEEDVVITVTIEGTEDNGWTPYGDMYHLTGSDPPVDYNDLSGDDWYTWLGDIVPSTGLPINPGYASFELKGGEVYLMEVYDRNFIFNSDFTIKTENNKAPSNDTLANATVISPSINWPKIITGSTEFGSQGITETINWDGSMTPSVWYVLDNQGPGAMSVIIESLTEDWPVQFETFYKTSDHTQMGVTEFDDLSQDGLDTTKDTSNGYLDLSDYAMFYGFETNNPADGSYDWDPLVGGEKFYIRVTGYNGDGQYDVGQFRLTVFVAPPAVCLDAVDYINTGSTTTSIVSGNVRETQHIPLDGGGIAPYPKTGYSGWLDEQVATLIIPGEDIASEPGLYSVTIKHKNTPIAFNWVVGMRRNGQPLEPGAEMNANSTSTPVTEWLTMMAGSPHPNEIDMLAYLPVQPGDEIEIVAGYNDYDGPLSNIDIYQVCFQRMLNAVEAPPYAQLEIPDFPMGTVSSDMGTNDQQGDLMIYKDTPAANNYTGHRSTNADLVVTNDGTLWCLARWMCTGGVSNNLTIGPALMKWTGSSWSIVNDDVFGLGVKRSQVRAVGWSLSMDTDGEDIWVCSGSDGGQGGLPGSSVFSSFIKVRKYDVSANSWSDVGSPFHGTRSHVGNPVSGEWTPAIAGDFGETPIIRVSPAGVPWVSFTDSFTPDISEAGMFSTIWQIRPYVARWTGSTWDVDLLPGPYEASDDYSSFTKYEAESQTLGPTASTTTYLGVSCVTDTQTSAANDTISFTPPAGKWAIKWRTAKDWIGPGASGFGLLVYKNGVVVGGQSMGAPGQNSIDLAWSHVGWLSEPYFETDGSDVISIRMWKTGGPSAIYLDWVALIDAHTILQNVGFGFNARFNDDGQPKTMLYMHQVGETGLGENPGVLYPISYTRPFLSIAERDAADPPVGWDSMNELNDATDNFDSMVQPPEVTGNFLWNWQTWVYCEWNGSQWVKKWNKLIEEDAPNHLYVQTLYDGISSSPPVGHADQVFGGCTDGIKNYMTANLFGGQAFGFFGDTIVALAIGEEGFEPFTDGPPGAIQGPGYPQGVIFGLQGFSGWGWPTGGRSIHVDTNGNVWLAWNALEGAAFNYSDFIAVAANNNMTTELRGLPGWYAAAEENESLGQDNTYMPVGHVVSSPNGDTLYVLFDAFLWADASSRPYTFGVYECPITQNAKIPLIPIFLRGKAVKVYPDGRMEIINAPQKRITVSTTGEVTVEADTESKRVSVSPSGDVTVLGV